MDDAGVSQFRSPSPRGREVHRRRIGLLWADDEAKKLHPYAEIMRVDGIEVHCVPDGASALSGARLRPWDLILLDVRLPDMSGLNVLKRLRADRVSTPVVILTGYPGDVVEETVAELDARIWLKPLPPTKLAELVHAEVKERGLAPRAGIFRRPDGLNSSACEALLSPLRQIAGDRGAAGDLANRRDDLLATLAVALAADVTFFEWLVMARAFAGLMTLPLAMLPTLADRLAQDLASAAGPVTAQRDILLGVVACIEAAGAGWRALTLTNVAASLRIDERQIEASLRRAGFASFEHCRRAVAVRRALLELALTGEHVDQIAFAVGYEHRNALNRDFGVLLNVAPKAYRAVVAGRRRRPDAAM